MSLDRYLKERQYQDRQKLVGSSEELSMEITIRQRYKSTFFRPAIECILLYSRWEIRPDGTYMKMLNAILRSHKLLKEILHALDVAGGWRKK